MKTLLTFLFSKKTTPARFLPRLSELRKLTISKVRQIKSEASEQERARKMNELRKLIAERKHCMFFAHPPKKRGLAEWSGVRTQFSIPDLSRPLKSSDVPCGAGKSIKGVTRHGELVDVSHQDKVRHMSWGTIALTATTTRGMNHQFVGIGNGYNGEATTISGKKQDLFHEIKGAERIYYRTLRKPLPYQTSEFC